MIEFDFDKAMRQVRELRGTADDITAMSGQKLSVAINSVESSWKGRTGQQFLVKCKDLEIRAEKEAANIRNLADHLESVARMMEKAENEAKAAASSK